MNFSDAYRDATGERHYVCPGCSSAQRGPAQGGQVTCAQCRAPFALPDRSALLAGVAQVPMPHDDPGRIQQLRLQDGRPRVAAPTLEAVLGGQGVQPGREQEAVAIWQSLRMRSSQGDVGASEDLATLTLLLSQLPMVEQQPMMTEALSESTFDAAVLPRHKMEQLGRLARRAAAAGDRARAERYLSWMAPSAPELDADSEFRVSSAVVATLARDGNRVLALLGPQKDVIPIVDSMDPLASVFRANALELLGNVAAAAQILRELPDPRTLDMVRGRFPRLQLCAQSGTSYQAVATQQAAARAASSAGGIGCLVGAILGGIGAVMAVIALITGLATGDLTNGGVAINGGIGVVMLVVGVVVVLRARASGKRAAWLRTNGLSLQARIVNAELTGTRINNVPVLRFILQVAGPQGPYASSFTKLVPEHQVALLIGRDVRVRANPSKLDEVVLED